MNRARLITGLAALAFLGPAPADAADAVRGKLLYEARCTACHGASVHQRESRKAASFAALRGQVARWNAEVGERKWNPGEVGDVAVYLNGMYYHFPCPEADCGGGRVADRGLGAGTADAARARTN